MANVILRPDWQLRERDVTPEAVYLHRREVLRGLGLSALGFTVLGLGAGAACASSESDARGPTDEELFPGLRALSARASEHDPGRPLTPAHLATRYNNYYEFTTDKDRVWRLASGFTRLPWEVELGGLCERRGRFDLTDVVDFDALEERRYRFRCVEAWSMTVPWIGVPLRKIIEWARPRPRATHVRFVSVHRPAEMPGQESQGWYPWPYFEGLRMDEAMHDLTLAVVGLYGRELTPQNGGPLRIIVPWKYGYKSPKAIARIEFVARRPHTFWNDLQPREYPFLSNVDPSVPHPRWSQATERLLDTGRRIPTLPYNGYADLVASLYA